MTIRTFCNIKCFRQSYTWACAHAYCRTWAFHLHCLRTLFSLRGAGRLAWWADMHPVNRGCGVSIVSTQSQTDLQSSGVVNHVNKWQQ